MYIIIYNPLARNNRGNKSLKQAIKELKIKEPIILSVLDFDNNDDLVPTLAKYPKDYKIILIGGDGTLNKFISRYRNANIEQEILFYSKGTGNDFQRNFPSIEKTPSHRLLEITKHINKTKVSIGEEQITSINAIGAGIDGLIIKNYHNAKRHNKISYTLETIKAFLKYEPTDVCLILDGEKYEFKRCWLVAINNGQYFGGGMQIAPHAIVNDDLLDICVIHSMSRLELLFSFPTVFQGGHLKLKKVFYKQAKKIKYSAKEPRYIQYDGELVQDKFNKFSAEVE